MSTDDERVRELEELRDRVASVMNLPSGATDYQIVAAAFNAYGAAHPEGPGSAVQAELERLRAELERANDALAEADQRQTRLEEQRAHTEGCVMDEIAGAGLAGHVCDDDDLPDMVRHALTAAKRLAQPVLAAEPGYERIADAIDDALKSADLRIELKTGTGSDWGRFTDSYSRELYVLARCLDKAGLIDWSAFGAEGVA